MQSDSVKLNQKTDSVGIVKPKLYVSNEVFELVSGKSLASFELVYETYGELNANKSNAVLICHALSGHHHAAGYHDANDKKPGWWDNYIGPGKPINTDKFFVVCLNNLGGCHGSTGPSSMNIKSKQEYGPDFPVVTVKDWVRSQKKLAEYLGIDVWAAVIGGSLGGMQVMQWAQDFPDQIRHAVVIASAPKLSAQNIAFNEIARRSIISDPEFNEGRFYNKAKPESGLMIARMLGHITYLSDESMKKKFDRAMQREQIEYGYDVEFQVESYLRYQGEAFSKFFDANTYLLMTKALDYYDPASDYDGSLVASMQHVKADFLVISFNTDWRFSSKRSKEIVDALIQSGKNVVYADIEADMGHDSFLLYYPRYYNLMKAYLDNIKTE